MKLTKKLAIGVAAAAALSAGSALAAYPEKPIKIMVGFSAGGGTDTTARGFASYMHEAPSLGGTPGYIVNLPGASGQKAAKAVPSRFAVGCVRVCSVSRFPVNWLMKLPCRPVMVTP